MRGLTKTLLQILVTLIALCIGFAYFMDYIRARSFRKYRAEMLASYMENVSVGNAPEPASTPEAFIMYARCSGPIPTRVEVKTASGEHFSYAAKQGSISNGSSHVWTFLFIGGEDAKGRPITNWPNF